MLKKTILTMALVLFTACTSPHPDAVTQAQGHDVALYVTPGVSGESNDLRVEVRGSRIPDISEVALTMPDGAMPSERVPLKEEGNGSYSAANVQFSMAGTWHVSILERDAKGTHQFATLRVTVR